MTRLATIEARKADAFRANPASRATWRGIARADADILAAHLAEGTFKPDKMWTSVPVGSAPEGLAVPDLADVADGTVRRYFKRVDILALAGGSLSVVECNPAAGFVALGQVLCYAYLIDRQWSGFPQPKPIILTDAADPDLRDLWSRHGITVYELPGHTYTPIGRPT